MTTLGGVNFVARGDGLGFGAGGGGLGLGAAGTVDGLSAGGSLLEALDESFVLESPPPNENDFKSGKFWTEPFIPPPLDSPAPESDLDVSSFADPDLRLGNDGILGAFDCLLPPNDGSDGTEKDGISTLGKVGEGAEGGDEVEGLGIFGVLSGIVGTLGLGAVYEA
jgi:hypothetical protein